LLINDDPEYQWIDKIRTPRTSNEARQKLFTKLSGELQRRIGLKCLEQNANCVLGYQQNFDLEGEHGIVVRGIGTAANITKQSVNANTTPPATQSNNKITVTPPSTNGLHNLKLKTTAPNSNNNNNTKQTAVEETATDTNS
jgi:hypothetical protein